MYYFLSTKEIVLILRRIFPSELRINLNEGRHEEGDRAERHHNNKECAVADCILEKAAEHAWHLQA